MDLHDCTKEQLISIIQTYQEVFSNLESLLNQSSVKGIAKVSDIRDIIYAEEETEELPLDGGNNGYGMNIIDD